MVEGVGNIGVGNEGVGNIFNRRPFVFKKLIKFLMDIF